jgi:hypothetical protein
MIARNLHNRIVVSRVAFLSIIMMIIVLNVSVLAQSTLPPCNGLAQVSQTAAQACGALTNCTGSNNCTAWFMPNNASIERCQSPNPPVPTAICTKTSQLAICGNGGDCVLATDKTCIQGKGYPKDCKVCVSGKSCIVD